LNPYATRRSPSGSSSGPAAAAAASLCAGAIGTETDGSILAPSSRCGLVGFKPTVGLVSGVGVVPITPRQDTAGPIARSVADAALLFEVMAEHGVDNRPTKESFEGFRLKGLRIGVLSPPTSAHPEAIKRWPEWHEPLAAEGAILIQIEPPKTLAQIGDAELPVMQWEFKAAINNYLQRNRDRIEVKTLTDLIAFNRARASEEMPIFGQDLFEDADRLGDLTTPAYRQACDYLMNLADTAGLATLFARYRVDVLLAMADGPAELIDSVWGDRPDGGSWPSIASAAAVAGYPSVTVPAGLVRGLPVGVVFVAPRHHDGTLLHIAHAYERATRARRPPTYAAG
jgi:amidase